MRKFSIDDKSSWSLIYLLFSLFLYLTLSEHVRQTFQIYICSRLIEFFLSLFCSRTRRKKKKKTRAYSPIATNRTILFPSLSLSFSLSNETRNNYIHWCGRVRGAIRKRDGEEKKKKRPFVYIHYHAITQNTVFFLFLSNLCVF